MKKIILIIASAIIVNDASAQQGKNQLVLSIGTANNINGAVVQIGAETSKATPVFNINVDRGMNERFSMGIAYCYQNISLDRNYAVNTTITTNNGSYNNITTTTVSDKYVENSVMQHIGVKFLFHSDATSKGDFYGGLRLGYQIAKTSSTLPSSVQDIISKNQNNNNNNIGTSTNAYTWGDANLAIKNKNRYTQQLILGYRYFWDESFGVYGEGALGFPYFLNFGMCLRFN